MKLLLLLLTVAYKVDALKTNPAIKLTQTRAASHRPVYFDPNNRSLKEVFRDVGVPSDKEMWRRVTDRFFQKNTLPVGEFPCDGINLLKYFNDTYLYYTLQGVRYYYADQITYICESTPATISYRHDPNQQDKANILMYRKGSARQSRRTASVNGEVRECQRYSFSTGPPPQQTSDQNAPCTEGMPCPQCANLGNFQMYILRGNGTTTNENSCRFVRSCETSWYQYE